jgi:hypothetical protein
MLVEVAVYIIPGVPVLVPAHQMKGSRKAGKSKWAFDARNSSETRATTTDTDTDTDTDTTDTHHYLRMHLTLPTAHPVHLPAILLHVTIPYMAGDSPALAFPY